MTSRAVLLTNRQKRSARHWFLARRLQNEVKKRGKEKCAADFQPSSPSIPSKQNRSGTELCRQLE